MGWKPLDFLFVSILAVSTSATVFAISAAKKTQAIVLAGVTSAVAGFYVVNSKRQLESKIDDLIASRDRINPDNFNSKSTIAPVVAAVAKIDSQRESADKQRVIDWLESLNIRVTNYHQAQSADLVYDRLSLTLGDNYQSLEKLYRQIKKRLASGENFKLSLSGKNQHYINQNTSFCSQLYEYTFLANYRYLNSSKTIIAAPNRRGETINFFSGQWFERFVYLKISQLLTYQELNYQCLLNPEIITPQGQNFELDIVFIIEEVPLWIECKTGQYQSYVEKYARFRRTLNIPKNRAFLAILGISDRLAEELTQMYDLIVTNENLFFQDISQLFNDPQQTINPNLLDSANLLHHKRTIRVKPHTIRDREELLKVLKKLKLRPAPKWRKIVFLELIKIVSQQDYTVKQFKEIREILFVTVAGISKSILIDILNTLIVAECLLDPEKQPLYSYNQNLSALNQEKLEVLETACLRVYALAICLTDPDYFATPSNLVDFQTVTGIEIAENLDLLAIAELARKIREGENPISTVDFTFDRS